MTIELVPLGRMTAQLRDPIVLDGTPVGMRLIFEVEAGDIVGERLNATLEGAANADWFVVGPGGVGMLDVRVLARTHDDALVLIQYEGRTDLTKGPGAPLYATPRFETGDERYQWLNRIQAVGKGLVDGRTLTYELYELR